MSRTVRKAVYGLVLLAALVVLLTLFPDEAAPAERDGPAAVQVINFPRVQPVALDEPVEVEGKVEIARQARAVALGEAVVAAVRRDDASKLVSAGTLRTDGYGRVVLSFTGELRGRGLAGQAGVILVPDVEHATRALVESRYLLPLAVGHLVQAEGNWIAASSEPLPIAFPSYQVYLFNESGRTADLRVYAYLSG